MPKVTFIPDEVTIEVRQGENLLRAAMMADVQISASCGGDGSCGKCRVVVESGSVDAPPSARLTAIQAAEGHVLSCVAHVTGDAVVRVPPESRPGQVPTHAQGRRASNAVLSADGFDARLPQKKSPAPVTKRRVTMSEPSLTDNVSDLTRLRHTLRREHRLKDVNVPLAALRRLPHEAREGEWTITATIAEPCEVSPWIAGFESGDTTSSQYAAAVDVGTTTVELALIDLTTGEVLAQVSEYNAQVSQGDDVISRVIRGSKPDGLVELNRLVIETISRLAVAACVEADAHVTDIICYVAAGNTVMTHLLYSVSPASIRTSPYVPAAQHFPWVNADELGLPGGEATQVVTVPCSASWLGGDIVAGVVAAGIPWTEKLTLFIDIGTNGELVLGSKDWMVSCSCSAGPAFEGGGILHGMRAAEGAIEQVRIDSETLDPSILTIGHAKPLGICGSGLIDVVSELFLTGAIGRSGRFEAGIANQRLRETDRGVEFVLVAPEDSGTGEAIVVTEADISSLMRAKAAIYAGIHVLAESLDVPIDAIEEVVIAGGFGHYLDLERVAALGMIPEIPTDRCVFVGNAALAGARISATSRDMLGATRRVAEMMTYLELSVNAAFSEAYVSGLFLPHTDLAQFPRTERLLAERSRTAVS